MILFEKLLKLLNIYSFIFIFGEDLMVLQNLLIEIERIVEMKDISINFIYKINDIDFGFDFIK